MHIMAHYCSRHKMDLPIENFTVTGNHVTDHCNACLEKDCVQLEAQHTKCAAALVDTLTSAISFNELCSELVVLISQVCHFTVLCDSTILLPLRVYLIACNTASVPEHDITTACPTILGMEPHQ